MVAQTRQELELTVVDVLHSLGTSGTSQKMVGGNS